MPECECSCTNAQYKVQLYFSILTNAGCVCCAVRARYNSERATIQMMIHANQIDRYLSTVMLLALVWCLTTLCVATGNFTIARKKNTQYIDVYSDCVYRSTEPTEYITATVFLSAVDELCAVHSTTDYNWHTQVILSLTRQKFQGMSKYTYIYM